MSEMLPVLSLSRKCWKSRLALYCVCPNLFFMRLEYSKGAGMPPPLMLVVGKPLFVVLSPMMPKEAFIWLRGVSSYPSPMLPMTKGTWFSVFSR